MITEKIADQLLYYSQENNTYEDAVIVRLLLSGVWSEEIERLTIGDINLCESTIYVHGIEKYRTRKLHLESHVTQILGKHISDLNSGDPTRLLCTQQDTTTDRNPTYITSSLYRVINHAGLNSETITPHSLTAYAGWCMFQATSRVEDVANLLGLHSLDSAADIIGFRWQGK